LTLFFIYLILILMEEINKLNKKDNNKYYFDGNYFRQGFGAI